MPPGLSVHVPVAGKPFKTLLPVGTTHVGCITDINFGAAGAPGAALTVKGVAVDTHAALVVVTL